MKHGVMEGQEQVEMMQRCIEEIRGLRREIEHLRPKAHAYDQLATVLGMFPKPSTGMAEDLQWALQRRIDEVKKAMAVEPEREDA